MIFGSTSEFSKALIGMQRDPYVFGRHNCDYMSPGELIRQLKKSEHPLPNKMIINVNLDPPVTSMHDLDVMGCLCKEHQNIIFFYRTT